MFYKTDRGRNLGTSFDPVVDDEDVVLRAEGARSEFEDLRGPGVVVEGLLDDRHRELAALAERNKPEVERAGHGGSDDEAESVDPHHKVRQQGRAGYCQIRDEFVKRVKRLVVARTSEKWLRMERP
jgi:hypothetical protein